MGMDWQDEQSKDDRSMKSNPDSVESPSKFQFFTETEKQKSLKFTWKHKRPNPEQ